MTGSVFSIDYINAQGIPKVPAHLLPWIVKDRREAEEGCMVYDVEKQKHVHDGSGLTKSLKSLATAKNALAEKPTDAKMIAFLTQQISNAEDKVAFYRGKIYILDGILAANK